MEATICSVFPLPSVDCIVPHNTVRDKLYLCNLNWMGNYLAECTGTSFIDKIDKTTLLALQEGS
jgi:hypothetical protein